MNINHSIFCHMYNFRGIQAGDRTLFTQQHFQSDLYAQNPVPQSTVTIDEIDPNERRRKVVIAFDNPTEVKTIELTDDNHSKFWHWTTEHQISSVELPTEQATGTRSEQTKADVQATKEPQATSSQTK